MVSIVLGLYATLRGFGEPDDIALAIATGLIALAIRFTLLRNIAVGTLSVRITGIPPGEAPLWVREQWLGLAIPIIQPNARPIRIATSGVLTGPKGVWSSLLALAQGKSERMTGFLVLAKGTA